MADRPANLYEAVLAWERAKAACRPEAIKERAAAAAAEIFTEERKAEIMRSLAEQIDRILDETDGGRDNGQHGNL